MRRNEKNVMALVKFVFEEDQDISDLKMLVFEGLKESLMDDAIESPSDFDLRDKELYDKIKLNKNNIKIQEKGDQNKQKG